MLAGTLARVALVLAQAADSPSGGPVYETVVVAPPPRSRDGGFALASRAAATLPGAGGDPGRALENAPGVGRLAPSSDGLVLWGAAPQESRVLLDGMELPALFHYGGWRSLLPVDAMAGVAVRPGALAADLGRALGGIVSVDSAAPNAEQLHGFVALDPLDGSAGVLGPLGHRTAGLVTARLGYVDRLASIFSSTDSRALQPLPAYRDLLIKTTVDLGPGQELTVEAVAGDDQRQLALRTSSPIDMLNESRVRDFARLMLRFVEVDEESKSTVLLWVGRDHTQLTQELGLVPVGAQVSAYLVGLKLARSALVRGHRIELGVDTLLSAAACERFGSLTHPPREGDLTVFGAAPSGATGSDAWRPLLGNVAPYLLAELYFGPLEVRPGLRIDGQLVSGDRRLPPTGLTPRVGYARTSWAAEPRLAISAALRPWLTLGGAAGIQHQAPAPADLSPVFGSPSLEPSRSASGVLSLALAGRGLHVEAAGFGRSLDGLATRNPDAQPALAQALVPSGRGRSYGAQIMARRDCRTGGICAMASYTLSRSERRGPGDSDWRLLDYDQPHLLAAMLGYRGQRWFGGARLRYASGMPRTPVIGAYFDSTAGLYRPLPGQHNATRLPAVATLDLRAERVWRWRPASLTVSLEVVNATDRTNPEEIVYSGDYARHAFIAGLPRLALLGLRLDL